MGRVGLTPENTLAIAVDFQERLLPAMNGKDELIRNSSIYPSL